MAVADFCEDAIVVGAGPAGLIAAETLVRAGARVVVYERMPSVGRKFLLAGRGGLNLTHAEPFEPFLARYGPAAERIRPALEAFPPDALREWAAGLGQETFVGSSGRVFPDAWKASPLLRAWLGRLAELGVSFRLRHRWIGFGPGGALRFDGPDGETTCAPRAAILALGGGSWSRLGSDGSWAPILESVGIQVPPLRPANCALEISWSPVFRERFEGEPLKRIALSHRDRSRRGETVVTARGLEGGAVYALSAGLRDEIERSGSATLRVDLRPDLAATALTMALSRPRGKQSLASHLRKNAKLSPVGIGLMREAVAGAALPRVAGELAAFIKNVPIEVTGTDTLDRAISSAGGITLDEVDEAFMLKRLPGVFASGEMLDWEAPTGGYLLQGCFSSGVAAARGALDWMNRAMLEEELGELSR